MHACTRGTCKRFVSGSRWHLLMSASITLFFFPLPGPVLLTLDYCRQIQKSVFERYYVNLFLHDIWVMARSKSNRFYILTLVIVRDFYNARSTRWRHIRHHFHELSKRVNFEEFSFNKMSTLIIGIQTAAPNNPRGISIAYWLYVLVSFAHRKLCFLKDSKLLLLCEQFWFMWYVHVYRAPSGLLRYISCNFLVDGWGVREFENS